MNSVFCVYSTESGWDNPFRPDGDLSREADEIVSLIKGGKPITPTPPPVAVPQLPACEEKEEKVQANNVNVIDFPMNVVGLIESTENLRTFARAFSESIEYS